MHQAQDHLRLVPGCAIRVAVVCLVLNCIFLRVHVRAPRYNSCIHFYKRPRPIARRTGARNVQLSEPSRFCDPCRIHVVSPFAFSLHLALPRREDESISSRAVSSSCRNCGSDSPRARPNAAILHVTEGLSVTGGHEHEPERTYNRNEPAQDPCACKKWPLCDAKKTRERGFAMPCIY